MSEETLAEAQGRLFATLKAGEGMDCPCCDRYAQIYSRPINKTQARGLIWLFRMQPDDKSFINLQRLAPRWLVSSNQMSTLKYWNLVEQQINNDKKKRNSGCWRLTDKGRDFVTRAITVPKVMMIYNDTVVGRSEDKINIDSALGKRFSYEELMTGEIT
jgi:hypothetical protein